MGHKSTHKEAGSNIHTLKILKVMKIEQEYKDNKYKMNHWYSPFLY